VHRSDISYAHSGDINIAYQIVGSGPLDLVFVPGYISNLALSWEEPRLARFLERLGSFCRLIMFDKRGTGLSDPVPPERPPTLEVRMDDVRAVLDAADSEHASLLGFSEGGAMAALFAATYPQRTRSLILWGSAPRLAWAEDWPWGVTRADGLAMLEKARKGEAPPIEWLSPTAKGDPVAERWWSRMYRLSASPSMVASLLFMNGRYDVRDVLPAIRAPTLILHRTGDRVIDVRSSRSMAEQIPEARYVELSGSDHWPWFGDTDAVLSEIETFVTGTKLAPPADRRLATILFTDIVGSTRLVTELGDAAWKQVLDQHDRISDQAIETFEGRLIKRTGDGAHAVFDRPGRGIQCAVTIRDQLEELGLELRAGLHTGECEFRDDEVDGVAVHLAARVAAEAEGGDVLVTRTIRDLMAGSGIGFSDRGSHELHGFTDTWELYAVE
jgi:pimeloyl-ACP methyl ester carboxylesterase